MIILFQELFLQIHQDIDKLEQEFGKATDIDEELNLLEKYLIIKELNEDLTFEIDKLNKKLILFESEHGLHIDGTEKEFNNKSYENGLSDEEDQSNTIELDERDFLAFQKGIGYYDLWMYDQAIVYLTKIIKKYPDFNLARLYTAMTYFKKSDYSDAKREALLILNLSDDKDLNSLGHNILGMIYSYEQEYEQAVNHFQEALNLNTEWIEPKFNLAVILYKLNRFEEAVILFEELYSNNPNDWEVLLYLGKSYQGLKQYDLAGEFFKQTFIITKQPAVIKQITDHFERRRNFLHAITWYEKWAAIEPKNFEPLFGLAKNHWFFGDKKKGSLYLKKSLSIDKENVKAILLYAWMLIENNDKNAVKVLNFLAKKNKSLTVSDFYLTAHMARLYYLNSDINKANQFCSILLDSKHPNINNLGHIVKGLIYLDQNEPELAIEHWHSITEENFPYRNFFLGFSYYLLGNNEKAKYHWSNFSV